MCVFISSAIGQSTGSVSYKYLGIQFTVPNGWIGQEVEGGYLIGHNTEPGFAFLSTLEVSSMQELQTLAQQGMTDESGTYLQLSSQLENISQHAVGGEYQGTLQGTVVRAYMIGVLNPQGSSVLILAATSPQQYSSIHKQLALELARSIVFSQAEIPPIALEWKQKLSDARLTYRDSHYSGASPTYNSDGSPTGSSSYVGYSQTIEIHLCRQGFFKYRNKSRSSIDAGGGTFGNTASGNAGDGRWEIVGDYQGNPVLKLLFNNGEVYEYSLAYQDNKTLLNGERYFVTNAQDGPDYAPDCF